MMVRRCDQEGIQNSMKGWLLNLRSFHKTIFFLMIFSSGFEASLKKGQGIRLVVFEHCTFLVLLVANPYVSDTLWGW